MNLLTLSMAIWMSLSSIWQPDMETAKKVAKTTGHPILLNFSGSDWCIPCIRMHKDIFENESFLQYADSSLVLLNADFPRSKKNQLDKTHQKKNDDLAERYNPEGKFPYTVLLDEEGKLLHAWDGYPDGGLSQFINEIRHVNTRH